MSRLEEIKNRYKKIGYTLHSEEEDDDVDLLIEHFVWLIQRAELYELTSSPISHKLAKLNKFIQERHFGDWGHSTIDISMDLILVLEERNNRYKQALEEIEKENSLYFVKKIARQALEGTE